METPKKEATKKTKSRPQLRGLDSNPTDHTYKSAFVLRKTLAPLKNTTGMTPSTILKIVDLKDNLDKHYQKFFKAFHTFFDGYPTVESIDNPLTGDRAYQYMGHPQEAAISDGIFELESQKVEISPINFLSDQEFATLTSGSTIEELSILRRFLLKN